MKRLLKTIIFAGMVAGLTAGAEGKGVRQREADTIVSDSISVVVTNPETCRKEGELCIRAESLYSDSVIDVKIDSFSLEVLKSDVWVPAKVLWGKVIRGMGPEPDSAGIVCVDISYYERIPGRYRLGLPVTVSPKRLPDPEKYRRMKPLTQERYRDHLKRKGIVWTEFDME